MPRWTHAAAFGLFLAAPAIASAQIGNGVNQGVSSTDNVMQGSSVNDVNGINANGTPRSQSPGASMTVGAGNSTMIPGVAGGGPGSPPIVTPGTGTATPTINGKTAVTPGDASSAP